MMEFFSNIWAGILENKDKIILFLTSSQFIGFLTAIVALYKSNKNTKANTKSANDLNDALIANTKNCEDSELAANNTAEIKMFLSKMDEKFNELETKLDSKLDAHTAKMNAIIEVQSIVYSTIKDEKVRSTVNNLLTNAKYSETATRAELKLQIESLKNEVAEKAAALAEFVNSTSNKVATILDGDKTNFETKNEENVVERY